MKQETGTALAAAILAGPALPSDIVMRVDSRLLGEEIIIAGEHGEPPEENSLVVYRIAEIVELLQQGCSPETMPTVHALKREFPGARIQAQSGLDYEPQKQWTKAEVQEHWRRWDATQRKIYIREREIALERTGDPVKAASWAVERVALCAVAA